MKVIACRCCGKIVDSVSCDISGKGIMFIGKDGHWEVEMDYWEGDKQDDCDCNEDSETFEIMDIEEANRIKEEYLND